MHQIVCRDLKARTTLSSKKVKYLTSSMKVEKVKVITLKMMKNLIKVQRIYPYRVIINMTHRVIIVEY